MGDIKKKAAVKAGINEDKLQLFWHNKELTPEFNTRTLLEMNLHTGFSLMGEACEVLALTRYTLDKHPAYEECQQHNYPATGYDLSVEPVYFPPVKKTPHGLEIMTASEATS